jgi:short-chain fatty acids transporter
MFQTIINVSVKLVRRYLPDPFVFAIILTIIAFIAAMLVTGQGAIEVLNNWGNGIWGLLGFAMQMALVIVCGSALAEAKLVKRGLKWLASGISSPVMAIAVVTVVSSVACWLNWGFGLIVGVVFAKEIAKQVKMVDYRLLIASAYSGFVVWHGGISGSVPLAMATEGEVLREVSLGYITSAIPISETIFAPYNLVLVVLVVIALTVVNSMMHPKGKNVFIIDTSLLNDDDLEHSPSSEGKYIHATPAERLNSSHILSGVVVLMGGVYFVYRIFILGRSFDLNSAILVFLLLGIIFYGTPIKYVNAITKASRSCAGILLQFPFYAGIMGIMTVASGNGVSLAGEMSEWCISVANKNTFPILSFISAGLVNIFVPSGGGQWAVQGPIMIPAGVNLGVDPSVVGMAISWGDAWTNLIQPFWAIPALAIAKLDAKDIMGFCLIDLLVVGIIICGVFLLLV